MKFLFVSTILNIKKIVLKPSLILVFLFVLIFPFFINFINIGLSISVGIYGAEIKIDNSFINIINYNSREELEGNIISGKINFGYVFEDGVTLITTELSFGYNIINEIITAHYLEQNLEEMTIDFLQIFFESNGLYEFVQREISFFMQEDIFMQAQFYGQYATEIQEIINFETLISNSIFGIVVTAFLVFLTPYFIKEKSDGITKALKVYKREFLYTLSAFLSFFVILFFLTIIGTRGVSIQSILLFSFLNSFFISLLVYFLKSAMFIQNFGIFFVVSNILVIINFSEFNEVLGIIQMLFPLFWLLHLF